jgi:hypothetical protein
VCLRTARSVRRPPSRHAWPQYTCPWSHLRCIQNSSPQYLQCRDGISSGPQRGRRAGYRDYVATIWWLYRSTLAAHSRCRKARSNSGPSAFPPSALRARLDPEPAQRHFHAKLDPGVR